MVGVEIDCKGTNYFPYSTFCRQKNAVFIKKTWKTQFDVPQIWQKQLKDLYRTQMAQIARIIFKPHTESQSGTEGLSPADMADIADIFFVE